MYFCCCCCCYSTCISFLSLSPSSTAWQTKSLLPTYRRSQSAVSQWRPQLRQQPQLLQQQQQQQHQLIATSSFSSSARSPALLPCQLVLRICLSLYLLQHPLQIKFISQLPVSQAHTHSNIYRGMWRCHVLWMAASAGWLAACQFRRI